jgi:hypothetical protein
MRAYGRLDSKIYAVHAKFAHAELTLEQKSGQLAPARHNRAAHSTPAVITGTHSTDVSLSDGLGAVDGCSMLQGSGGACSTACLQHSVLAPNLRAQP